MLVTYFFSAFTTDRLEANDRYLPLSDSAKADLLAALPNPEDYMYLTLKGDVHLETVRVRNDSGTLIIDRGLEGTEPVLHHAFTCVSAISPTVVATIKDLICNYQCCEDGCECQPATYKGGMEYAGGTVGQRYHASFAFAGSLPMNMQVSGLPSWAEAVQTQNSISVTGTPTQAGNYPFTIAVTNCSGTELVMQQVTITIRD